MLAGQEVPIQAGAKLTGRIGRTDLGVLSVRTGGEGFDDKEFFVGRVQQSILAESSIGTVLTYGNPNQPIESMTYGVDLRLATSNFLGRSKNLVFNAFGLRSQNEGASSGDRSYGASIEYPNDLWEAELTLRVLEENFNPALGYVPRSGLRFWRVGGRYSPRPDFLGLEQIYNGIFFNHITRLSNDQTESWNLFFTIPADWHFRSGDALHAFLSPDIRYERLFEPFQIAPGVTLPVGEYRFTRFNNNFATSGRRPLMFMVRYAFGTYWSGSAHELQSTLTYRLPPRFSVSGSANQTFARLDEGNFVARTFTSTVVYAFSPFLSVTNLAQYDNRSRNLGWQGRIRWTPQPGSDLFLVFNQGWIQDDGSESRFHSGDSKISTKLQYTFRF